MAADLRLQKADVKVADCIDVQPVGSDTREPVEKLSSSSDTENLNETGLTGGLGMSPYDRFPPHRKTIMVVVMAWCGFLSPVSSTAVLSAIPNVADTFATTGSMISLSNALYLVFMALSPCFWGPLCQVFGRRMSCIATATVLFLCSIATALAPNIAAFFVFRIITAFSATAFLVIGPAVIGDLYHPTERATALSGFYTGALVGPTIGPLLGGIIVTYTSWRSIFWLQAGLAAVGVAGPLFLMSETQMVNENSKKVMLSRLPSVSGKAKFLAHATNPLRPIRLLLTSPHMILVAFASGTIVWNQYSLLTPIRYVLNPRFHLQTPTESGLFYLGPGVGYVVGTLGGGRWADHVTRRWIKRRNGERIPEDRLRSCVIFLGVILPASMLIYGWSIEKAVGGIPLPVVFMFVQGVAQSFCFPSLNTYCLDAIQARSAESVAGNFMVRYIFGAIGSAAVLPAIESIGVGYFSTISSVLMVLGGLSVYMVAKWGAGWRVKGTQEKEGNGPMPPLATTSK